MRLFVLALALLWPIAAQADRVIAGDNGGVVRDRALEVYFAKGPILVRGRCDSACTIYLSRDDVCVTPGASFGFHKPYGGPDGGAAAGERYMMKVYPGWVKAWLARRGGLTRDIKRMPASYAARFIGYC